MKEKKNVELARLRRIEDKKDLFVQRSFSNKVRACPPSHRDLSPMHNFFFYYVKQMTTKKNRIVVCCRIVAEKSQWHSSCGCITDAFCLDQNIQFYWFEFESTSNRQNSDTICIPTVRKRWCWCLYRKGLWCKRQWRCVRDVDRIASNAVRSTIWRSHSDSYFDSCGQRVCVAYPNFFSSFNSFVYATNAHRKPCANVISRMGHTGTIVRDATVKAMTLTRKIVSVFFFYSVLSSYVLTEQTTEWTSLVSLYYFDDCRSLCSSVAIAFNMAICSLATQRRTTKTVRKNIEIYMKKLKINK